MQVTSVYVGGTERGAQQKKQAYSHHLADMDYHGLTWTIKDYHGLEI